MQYQHRFIRRAAVATATAAAVAAAFTAGPHGTPASAQGFADATRPGGVIAYGYQFGIGAPGALIKVCWARPQRIPSSSVLGHVIWRSDPFTPSSVVGGRDSDSVRCFFDNEATRDVSAWDGVPGGDAGTRGTFGGVPGIQPGQRYYYQVTTAYRNGLQDRDGDGVPDSGAQFMSPLSSNSNFATAVSPSSVTSVDGSSPTPGQQVDLTNLTLTWQQTPGADTYVIWVARDPRMRKSRKVIGPVRVIPVDQGGDQTVTRTLNIRSRALLRSQRVFIAVGARNSADRIKPRPFGAIFSAPIEVHPETAPPGPP